MKTIILGASGLLGQVIYAQAAIAMIATTHAQLDVCDHAAVRQYLVQQRPQLVINCTAPTTAEKSPKNPANFSSLGKAISIRLK